MPSFPFEKWEGLGNDFIVVDAAQVPLDPHLARRLCDRRRGVGADGLLYVERNPPRMILLNADGSRPEMCGNGLRCLVGYLAPARETEHLLVQTDAGPRTCSVQWEREGCVWVTVDMGAARFDGTFSHPFEGLERTLQRVDMGNPHALTFEPEHVANFDAWASQASISVVGGTNVEFATIVADESGPSLDVIVWERGVGRTLACGTGACAAAAAACRSGYLPYGTFLRVKLPGGVLAISVEADTHRVHMRGPAQRAFRGVYSSD